MGKSVIGKRLQWGLYFNFNIFFSYRIVSRIAPKPNFDCYFLVGCHLNCWYSKIWTHHKKLCCIVKVDLRTVCKAVELRKKVEFLVLFYLFSMERFMIRV